MAFGGIIGQAPDISQLLTKTEANEIYATKNELSNLPVPRYNVYTSTFSGRKAKFWNNAEYRPIPYLIVVYLKKFSCTNPHSGRPNRIYISKQNFSSQNYENITIFDGSQQTVSNVNSFSFIFPKSSNSIEYSDLMLFPNSSFQPGVTINSSFQCAPNYSLYFHALTSSAEQDTTGVKGTIELYWFY